MRVRIAIPVPSSDVEYNERSFVTYLDALRAAGADPVEVPLWVSQGDVARLLAGTQGVLLPGSLFDVEPERYGEARDSECGPADPARTAVDELLIQDAFNLRKPVLGICYGAQSLSVWCGGKLVQDLKTAVVHRSGRAVVEAHSIQVVPGSRLGALLSGVDGSSEAVNSTHHQAVLLPGDGMRVAAVSPEDGVVEAIEIVNPEHFVVGVQWHPERTYSIKAFSRAIFSVFLSQALAWKDRAALAGGVDGQ